MNRDELLVSADQLQIEGDIRGEISALELLERPELTPQREALMTKWLGPNARGWAGVRFRLAKSRHEMTGRSRRAG